MSEQQAHDDFSHRAANGFLGASLPPHGRHAGQHDPGTTVRATDDHLLIVPSRAVPSAERAGNVVEVKLGQNMHRRGTVQASEGLAARDGRVASNFMDGFQVARAQQPGGQYVEAKLADGRSALADGSDSGNPTWASANDAVINFDFARSHGEDVVPQRNAIPALEERSTPATHTDLSRLDLRERPGNQFGKVYSSDVKHARPNEAQVRD